MKIVIKKDNGDNEEEEELEVFIKKQREKWNQVKNNERLSSIRESKGELDSKIYGSGGERHSDFVNRLTLQR